MFSNLLQPGFFRRLAQIVFLALLTAIWLIFLLGAYDYETQLGSESSSIAALLRYVIAATAVVLAAPFMMRLRPRLEAASLRNRCEVARRQLSHPLGVHRRRQRYLDLDGALIRLERANGPRRRV